MACGDLTDEEWSLVEPHLPLGERGPIPDLRQQFNAVMWRFRTCGPWRDLPAEYGPWPTAYDRFRMWAVAGVFERIMQAAIAEVAARGQGDLDLGGGDCGAVRAHRHAAGMVFNGELVRGLERAVEEERELRQRGQYRTVAPAAEAAKPSSGEAAQASTVEVAEASTVEGPPAAMTTVSGLEGPMVDVPAGEGGIVITSVVEEVAEDGAVEASGGKAITTDPESGADVGGGR